MIKCAFFLESVAKIIDLMSEMQVTTYKEYVTISQCSYVATMVKGIK